MPDNSEENNVNCRNCRFFYITWDAKFPYGCNAIKFKSKGLPSAGVFKESGMPCMLFETKPKKDRKA